MFTVRYINENDKSAIEQHSTNRSAEERVMMLRREFGIMAYVENDYGEYRFYH